MIPHIRPKARRDPNLVWVASYPKSGSTWMRMFVHAYLTDGTVNINEITGAGETGDLQKWLYEQASAVPLEELRGAESFYLRPSALYRLACLTGDQLVKTHCCNGVVHGIELIPQDFTKGAIYIMRDPRDVCISYAHHMGVDVDEAIRRMADPTLVVFRETRMQYLSTWSNHVGSWTDKPQFPVLYVKYEDMLAKPEQTFGAVARFMTDGLDEEKLKKSLDACRFEVLKKQEEDEGFIERSPKAEAFFREGRSTWRDTLTQAQVERIEADHQETMEKFGYGLVSNPPVRWRMLPKSAKVAASRPERLPVS